MANASAEFTSNYLSFLLGTPSNLIAGTIGYQKAPETLDKLQVASNLLSAIDSFLFFIKKVPVLGILAQTTSLTLALASAQNDIQVRGEISSATRLQLMSEALGLGVAVAASATLVAPPIAVTVAVLMATVAAAGSVTSARMGFDNKVFDEQLANTALSWLDSIGRRGESIWLTDGQNAKAFMQEKPFQMPVVDFLHMLSPRLRFADAVQLVDRSASGSVLAEAAATLNGIRRLITRDPVALITSPEELLSVLQSTFTSATPYLGTLDIHLWPDSAAAIHNLALSSEEVRAAMVLDTPFYARNLPQIPVLASEIKIFDPKTEEGVLTNQWLLDRSAYLAMRSRAHEAEITSQSSERIRDASLVGGAAIFVDIASGTSFKVGDLLITSAGSERKITFGGNADDTINGGVRRDNLYGGDGADTLRGEEDADYLQGDDGNDLLYGGSEGDTLVGGRGNDFLDGGSGNDLLQGDKGADTLEGGAGNDQLYGGTGTDTYNFSGTFGQDEIIDSDGQGSINLNGIVLTGGQSAGKPEAWVQRLGTGDYVGYKLFQDASSTTRYRMAIARPGNEGAIIINNFDRTAAFSSAGYLGIKLDNTQRVAIVEGVTSNPFAKLADAVGNVISTAALSFAERGARVLSYFLATPAAAGDVLTLALGGNQLHLRSGQQTIASGGSMTIAMKPGQTQVELLFSEPDNLGANITGQLSTTYLSHGEAGVTSTHARNVAVTVTYSESNSALEIGEVNDIEFDSIGGSSQLVRPRRSAIQLMNWRRGVPQCRQPRRPRVTLASLSGHCVFGAVSLSRALRFTRKGSKNEATWNPSSRIRYRTFQEILTNANQVAAPKEAHGLLFQPHVQARFTSQEFAP